MFKFARVISGPTTWTSTLFKEVEHKDERLGYIGLQDDVLYINIYKSKMLTAKELMLLLTQILQFNSQVLDKPFELNIVEEG